MIFVRVPIALFHNNGLLRYSGSFRLVVPLFFIALSITIIYAFVAKKISTLSVVFRTTIHSIAIYTALSANKFVASFAFLIIFVINHRFCATITTPWWLLSSPTAQCLLAHMVAPTANAPSLRFCPTCRWRAESRILRYEIAHPLTVDSGGRCGRRVGPLSNTEFYRDNCCVAESSMHHSGDCVLNS